MREEYEGNIPDSIRPYLNEIAERLWEGRAAIMVGAGFSKNAGQGFPDWDQLGDLFYQKAHGEKPDSIRQKYLNVLRLAEEVQAAIGRPALENLLRSNISDLTIEPSDLHVQLLELPWADVFTTNYDTLLERASAKVVTRRYVPVVNKEDIPYADKPRIVKLHGSFPSERPFIITEEDYRRYPHDFAPFVNTVQQALLENTFCLIGFSGDDPNFLQWIGWIRDNLGKDKTQKIYLVGVFNLSSAKLQLLAQRGIIVVDLSGCPGIKKHDHKQAFSKFFDYMRSKKPEVLDWPYNSRMMYPTRGAADRIGEVQKITEEWRTHRHAYPGWLILPYGNRENLWAFTQGWVTYLPETENSPPGLDILYAFELIWRLERCLLPIFSNISDFCEKLLEKYEPFQTENAPANCMFRAGDEQFKHLPWDEIRKAWLAISLAMLRFYREEGHLEKWKEAENRLKHLYGQLSAEQKEFLYYEGYLFGLFTLDLPNAKQRLEEWRPNESQPYWIAKRAAAIAEIGQLNESEAISREALEHIRKKLNQQANASIALLSQESNAMLLGKYIKDAAAIQRNECRRPKDTRIQLNDRWNELKGFKCDPWNELKLFELILSEPPTQRKDCTEKHEFDIGRVTRTYHFSCTDQEGLTAYAFLRFCEEVGLPYRLGNYTLATKTAVGCLLRISRYSPFWATATFARLGDEKAVDDLFNRESVHGLTTNEADQLVLHYLEALKKGWDDIRVGDAFRRDNFGVRLAQILPEVISRICCKCSFKAKDRILEFIAELYASPDKAKFRNVRNLTSRLLNSMSEIEQHSLVPKLLKIPFPGDMPSVVKEEFSNPFRFINLNKKTNSNLKALDILPGLVASLLQEAALDDADRRRWAITSLVTLFELKMLDADQSEKLAAVIWHITDEYGLPAGTDICRFAFMSLPHPEGIDPSSLFKRYVKNTPFPIQKDIRDGSVGMTGGNIPLVFEIIRANENAEGFWITEDVVEILQRLVDWWDADKNRLREMDNAPVGFLSIAEEFRSRFSRIVELVSELIGPKLSADSPDDIKSSLSRLLHEMREYGLPVLRAEAACLHIYPEQEADLYDRIYEALISNQDSMEKDGLWAIAKIIRGGIVTKSDSVGLDPVFLLSQYLTWCPIHSISQALWIVVRILETMPAHFTRSLEVATQKRLARLLTATAYDDNQEVPFAEKLEVRSTSAALAATLWRYYKSRNESVPCVVEKWHEVCLSPDEFSEIRNAWIDNGRL